MRRIGRREFLKLVGLAGAASAVGCDASGRTRGYPFQVDEDVCRGCQLCLGHCKADAIRCPVRSKYTVQKDICTGCGTCTHACRYGAARLGSDHKSSIDPAKCQLCGKCFAACPYSAIRADRVTARVDQFQCIHCGECVELKFCPYDAIYSSVL